MKQEKVVKTIHMEKPLAEWLEGKAKVERRSFYQTVVVMLEKLKKEEEANEHSTD